MRTCNEIRLIRLHQLVREAGGARRLADKIDKSEGQVRQWINQVRDSKTGKPRNIGDETARFLEAACGKCPGWMDNDPDTVVAPPEVIGPPHWSQLSWWQQKRVTDFIEGILSCVGEKHHHA